MSPILSIIHIIIGTMLNFKGAKNVICKQTLSMSVGKTQKRFLFALILLRYTKIKTKDKMNPSSYNFHRDKAMLNYRSFVV